MRKMTPESRNWLVAGEDAKTAEFLLAEVDRNEAAGNNTYTIVVDVGLGDRNPFYLINNGMIQASRHY